MKKTMYNISPKKTLANRSAMWLGKVEGEPTKRKLAIRALDEFKRKITETDLRKFGAPWNLDRDVLTSDKADICKSQAP